MISLADFEPLSVAKINIFFINNRGFIERYFSDKVYPILIEEVWNYIALWRSPV